MPLHLASLGSSFAAGPGILPIADEVAGRSAANYAALLAKHISATSFTDLTVSGATLLNITSQPQIVDVDNAHGGHPVTFPPQLTQLPPDADVVLVLGGGNDIGYIGNFFVDAARELPYLRDAMGLPKGSTPDDVPDLPPPDDDRLFQTDPLRALALRYAEVLDAIHDRVPAAHVLVVEYLAMLGPHTRPHVDVPFSREQIARHQQRAGVLEEATRLALRIDHTAAAIVSDGGQGATDGSVVDRSAWCSFVSVTESTRAEHAIGSPEPWVSSISPELVQAMGAFHPNVKGMIGVEKLVYHELMRLSKIV